MRSSGSIESMQFAVEVACDALIAELESGIAQYNKNRRYSNSRRICDLIEQFVDSLYQIPDWTNELINRATFVEKRCGDESKYNLARSEALKSYKGQPRKLSGSKLAIRRLRNSNRPLQLLAEVDSDRNDIKNVLDDGILDLSKESRNAFKKWERACRDVQREARVLNTDGCWYLYQIHACGEDTPSQFSKSARGMMLTDAGGVNLRKIKSAVDSLVIGVKGTAPANREPRPDDIRQPQHDPLYQKEINSEITISTVGPPDLVACSISKAVKLFGRDKKPIVNDEQKDKLTKAQYNVVLTLLKSGEEGLTKDELDCQSGHGGSRHVLYRLAKKDADWKAVISLPGTTGKGYRIK